jgi:hypothetical protein
MHEQLVSGAYHESTIDFKRSMPQCGSSRLARRSQLNGSARPASLSPGATPGRFQNPSRAATNPLCLPRRRRRKPPGEARAVDGGGGASPRISPGSLGGRPRRESAARPRTVGSPWRRRAQGSSGGGGARVRWWGWAGGGGRAEDGQGWVRRLGSRRPPCLARRRQCRSIRFRLGRRVGRCSGWRECRPATLLSRCAQH